MPYKRILKILERDARTPVSEIAQMVGQSEGEVTDAIDECATVKRLEQARAVKISRKHVGDIGAKLRIVGNKLGDRDRARAEITFVDGDPGRAAGGRLALLRMSRTGQRERRARAKSEPERVAACDLSVLRRVGHGS